jgi:hypothetical protein
VIPGVNNIVAAPFPDVGCLEHTSLPLRSVAFVYSPALGWEPRARFAGRVGRSEARPKLRRMQPAQRAGAGASPAASVQQSIGVPSQPVDRHSVGHPPSSGHRGHHHLRAQAVASQSVPSPLLKVSG